MSLFLCPRERERAGRTLGNAGRSSAVGGALRAGLLARVILLPVLLAGCSPGSEPDLIFHGGPVLTVDPDDRVVEAVAVRDGVITAVGPAAEVLPLRGPRTEVHDLQGNTLMPGFVASHEHPTLSAVFGDLVDLSGFTHRTDAQVWAALRAAVRQTPKGEWIFARGLDPILVPDLVTPNRRFLDAIAPDHPVVLVSQTLHSFWANSQAFAAAGIDRNTPDPGNGSFYGRDAVGELDGFISESTAAAPLVERLRSSWRVLDRYERVLDELLAAGFTSVVSPGYNVPPLLARYAASRRLQPRIRQFLFLTEEELTYLPDEPDRDNPFFRIMGVKLWYDGSPYTGSMFLEEPYLDTPLSRRLAITPGSRGESRLPPGRFAERIRQCRRDGWQVAVHSQGDRSSREVLQAFAAEPAGAMDANGPPRRLEHGVLLPMDLLGELARLRVSPSFHINHILYYGDALADGLLGPGRAGEVLPVRSAFEHGLRPTLHADSPMFPADGFSLMQTAILRRSRSGRVIGAHQAIRIDQALRAMTINGAWQLGLERQLGSIEVGKWADLQVVNANPYAVDPAQLDRIDVLAVYVAGRRQPIDR